MGVCVPHMWVNCGFLYLGSIKSGLTQQWSHFMFIQTKAERSSSCAGSPRLNSQLAFRKDCHETQIRVSSGVLILINCRHRLTDTIYVCHFMLVSRWYIDWCKLWWCQARTDQNALIIDCEGIRQCWIQQVQCLFIVDMVSLGTCWTASHTRRPVLPWTNCQASIKLTLDRYPWSVVRHQSRWHHSWNLQSAAGSTLSNCTNFFYQIYDTEIVLQDLNMKQFLFTRAKERNQLQ